MISFIFEIDKLVHTKVVSGKGASCEVVTRRRSSRVKPSVRVSRALGVTRNFLINVRLASISSLSSSFISRALEK
jgi:hypothetical protein